jgi:hypothetical protein
MKGVADKELVTILAALEFWRQEIIETGGAFAARERAPAHRVQTILSRR